MLIRYWIPSHTNAFRGNICLQCRKVFFYRAFKIKIMETIKNICTKQITYHWPNCDISRLFLVLFYLCDVCCRSGYLSDLWCLVKPRSESGPHSRPVPPLSAHAAGNGSTWWCTLSVRSKQTNHTFQMIWFYREEQLYISQFN